MGRIRVDEKTCIKESEFESKESNDSNKTNDLQLDNHNGDVVSAASLQSRAEKFCGGLAGVLLFKNNLDSFIVFDHIPDLLRRK